MWVCERERPKRTRKRNGRECKAEENRVRGGDLERGGEGVGGIQFVLIKSEVGAGCRRKILNINAPPLL